jgi:hypothetical protein
VQLVKEKFVSLAVDGRIVNYYEDSETTFLSKPTVCVANGASGGAYVVSASGIRLERGELSRIKDVFRKSLERGLARFEALPAAEREPGKVKVPERGPIDPKRLAAVGPPEGALVVCVYNRQLGRTEKGELRHTLPEDYLPRLRDPDFNPTPNPTDLFSQPANDFMWVTRRECEAMMPADPRVGLEVSVPGSLCERVFRYHLDPGRGFTESDAFAHVDAGAGRLLLTVEAVTENEVRLRLEGHAKLHNPRRHLLQYQSPGTKFSQSQIPLDYEPRLLGYVAYDPAKKRVTRFDVVALGETRGRPVDSNLFGERVNDPNLQGVAFELAVHPSPADFVSPKGLRGGGGTYDLRRYLGLKE